MQTRASLGGVLCNARCSPRGEVRYSAHITIIRWLHSSSHQLGVHPYSRRNMILLYTRWTLGQTTYHSVDRSISCDNVSTVELICTRREAHLTLCTPPLRPWRNGTISYQFGLLYVLLTLDGGNLLKQFHWKLFSVVTRFLMWGRRWNNFRGCLDAAQCLLVGLLKRLYVGAWSQIQGEGILCGGDRAVPDLPKLGRSGICPGSWQHGNRRWN